MTNSAERFEKILCEEFCKIILFSLDIVSKLTAKRTLCINSYALSEVIIKFPG